MKKFLSVLLAVLLFVTLFSGCKSKDPEGQQSINQETEYADEGEYTGDSAEVTSGSQASGEDVADKPSSSNVSSDKQNDNSASNEDGSSGATVKPSSSNVSSYKESSSSDSHEPPKSSACKHEYYDTKVKQDRDCENDGIKVCVCKECYYTWEVVVPAKGHTEVVDPGTPATYSNAGVSPSSYCSECGKVLSPQRTIPKLSKYETPEIPA